MKKYAKRNARLGLENLEQRDVPSVSSVIHNNYLVQINCNNNPSNVTVTLTGSEFVEGPKVTQQILFLQVKDTTNGFSHEYKVTKSSSTKIVFQGGSSADTFKNNAALACTAYGNGGNDYLVGGSLGDLLYGGSGNDTVSGMGGNDILSGDSGNDSLLGGIGIDKLYGGTGNDILKGDSGGDYIYGGNDADSLYGGTGNDNLFGGAGTDTLKGEQDSDFLDDGSNSTEVNDGGSGYDFLAYKPVNGSTAASDVNQYTQNTCWILSPIASAANSGMNLKSRITYLGNGEYNVKLFKGDGTAFYQKVSLLGGRYGFEPIPSTDESWVILFQRAILKQFVSDVSDPSTYPSFATSPSQSLPYLTGRSASFDLAGGTYVGTFGDGDIQKMADALQAGKLVCAASRPGDYQSFNVLGSVSSPYICGGDGHVYSVLSVNTANKTVTLRNPWGKDVSTDSDGKITHNMQIQGANDGIIVLSYADFKGSFAMMSIS